jgi:alpha-amylase
VKLDWKEKWYKHVTDHVADLADAEFDLVWLPPPSDGDGNGYHPRRLNNFDNNYGSLQDHRDLIAAILQAGLEPIADVVINHRVGATGWATFEDPEWPSTFICSDDEFWDPAQAPDSKLSAQDKVIRQQNQRGGPDFALNPGSKWEGARDLDHENPQLRAEIKAYLHRLRDFGYRGWRYDMVKGYDAKYVAEYDFDSKPTFAVGEFWEDDHPAQIAAWIEATRLVGQPNPHELACGAFDFPAWKQLKEMINAGRYADLRAISSPDGIEDGVIAVNRNKAVTFLENHDTGFPNENKDHSIKPDSFGNNAKLMQAYAFILTHPGVPCVYWKHYFEWNRGAEIKKLIKARKYAGVNAGSYIKTEVTPQGDYVAIVGDKPDDSSTLIAKIGPGIDFNPDAAEWAQETSGEGYAVWVRKTKKAHTQATVDAAKQPLPLPAP